MMIDSYLHMVPGFLNSQVSLGIWHAMATCSSHTLAVPDTTICSDSQVIIFGESTCSHALLVRARGGTTSVRPEVHGAVLAVTTCHMIS